jgi:hypothetical protein
MSMAAPSDQARDLARRVDAAAGRVRPWRIGHELARELTADGSSMTRAEAALVQGLERALDWTMTGADGGFRAWWLDEATALSDVHDTWPAVWAEVAACCRHPYVVAHLSDMLWEARYDVPHRHARAAVDAYLEAAATALDEPHDRGRALMRAHVLAIAINDTERSDAAAARLCEAANGALVGDRDLAIPLLEHLLGRRLTPTAETAAFGLVERAWQRATRTDHVVRLGKLLAARTEGDERQEILDRMISFVWRRANEQEGFAQLLALREALRLAEELGHPCHDQILHEIEMLDTRTAFTAVRTEHVVSREHVSAFCDAVVGADSLERALDRFALRLVLTPEAVQHLRDTTPIGIRHTISSVRMGEANSVVTSTDTADAPEDLTGC